MPFRQLRAHPAPEMGSAEHGTALSAVSTPNPSTWKRRLSYRTHLKGPVELWVAAETKPLPSSQGVRRDQIRMMSEESSALCLEAFISKELEEFDEKVCS